MTHTGWNTIGNAGTSFDVRRASPLLVLLVLLNPLQIAPASADHSADDFTVEVRVLRAFRQDSQLRPLNLSVRMTRGIAHLCGPVPSAERKQLAIKIAERVEGVLEVRAGELYITKSAQAPKPMFVRIEEDRPMQTRSASPHSLSNDGHPSRRTDSPIAAAPPRRAAPARLTVHPRPAAPIVSPVQDLERLRRGNARFQQIRTQVQGATVRIFPGETSFEDVMLFAQRVRRLPGVEQVIVASGSR